MQHDIPKEFKELRLSGMAGAWADLVTLGDSGVAASKWLISTFCKPSTPTVRCARSATR